MSVCLLIAGGCSGVGSGSVTEGGRMGLNVSHRSESSLRTLKDTTRVSGQGEDDRNKGNREIDGGGLVVVAFGKKR